MMARRGEAVWLAHHTMSRNTASAPFRPSRRAPRGARTAESPPCCGLPCHGRNAVSAGKQRGAGRTRLVQRFPRRPSGADGRMGGLEAQVGLMIHGRQPVRGKGRRLPWRWTGRRGVSAAWVGLHGSPIPAALQGELHPAPRPGGVQGGVAGVHGVVVRFVVGELDA